MEFGPIIAALSFEIDVAICSHFPKIHISRVSCNLTWQVSRLQNWYESQPNNDGGRDEDSAAMNVQDMFKSERKAMLVKSEYIRIVRKYTLPPLPSDLFSGLRWILSDVWNSPRLQLGGGDCKPEAQIAAWRLRFQPGGWDCSLRSLIAGWRFRLQPGGQGCSLGVSLEAQIGALRLRKLCSLCRVVPACGKIWVCVRNTCGLETRWVDNFRWGKQYISWKVQ